MERVSLSNSFFLIAYSSALVLNSSANSASQRLSLNHSTLVYPTTNPADFSIAEDSVPASPVGSDIEIEQDTPFKIGIVTHSVDNGPAIRVNTIQNFYEVNRRVSSLHSFSSALLTWFSDACGGYIYLTFRSQGPFFD